MPCKPSAQVPTHYRCHFQVCKPYPSVSAKDNSCLEQRAEVILHASDSATDIDEVRIVSVHTFRKALTDQLLTISVR